MGSYNVDNGHFNKLLHFSIFFGYFLYKRANAKPIHFHNDSISTLLKLYEALFIIISDTHQLVVHLLHVKMCQGLL